MYLTFSPQLLFFFPLKWAFDVDVGDLPGLRHAAVLCQACFGGSGRERGRERDRGRGKVGSRKLYFSL